MAVDDQGLVRAMVGSRNRYDGAAHANNYAVRGLGPKAGRPDPSPSRWRSPRPSGAAFVEPLRRRGDHDFDSPEALDAVGKPWKEQLLGERRRCPRPMEATKQSSNTFFAQLMLEIGPQSVADLAEQLGIGGGEQLAPNASMVLGTTEASPLEMAGMYSTFANRGVYKAPEIVTRVERVDQAASRRSPTSARSRSARCCRPSRPTSSPTRPGPARGRRHRPPWPPASRPQARPGPPSTTGMPGSPATSPSSPPSSGWAIRRTSSRWRTSRASRRSPGLAPGRDLAAVHGGGDRQHQR